MFSRESLPSPKYAQDLSEDDEDFTDVKREPDADEPEQEARSSSHDHRRHQSRRDQERHERRRDTDYGFVFRDVGRSDFL